METSAIQIHILSAIYAQYRSCEYQQQLILPSLVSVVNIFIYLLKCVKVQMVFNSYNTHIDSSNSRRQLYRGH